MRLFLLITAMLVGCTNFKEYSERIVALSLKKKYLRAHNSLRSKRDLDPIRWDDNLSKQAQDHSKALRDTCLPEDSFYSRFDNIHQGWGSVLATPAEVIRGWVHENDYELDNIMHPKTLAVGCAVSICRDPHTGAVSAIHICKYLRDDGFLDELFEDI